MVIINYYVIKDVDEVCVVLNDWWEFDVDIVLMDEWIDFVVFKIRNIVDLFDYVEFVSLDSLEVGDIVFVIGNLFGVGQIVIQGIVFVLV